MDHAGRLRRLQALLSGHKLDSLLIVHLPNVRYLCGFTGSAAALLVAERGSILFTDGRYRTQAKEEIKNAHVNKVSIVIARKSPAVAAAEWLFAQRRRAPPA
ncbi:MAG: aminopeptidase P family N-terminal domain-containing protein, partial [Terriglobales bacterium]